jgi:YjbR
MITLAAFKKLALSFPETSEAGHFENTSFRIGKKIFATLNQGKKIGCVKLSLIDQSAFSSFDKTVMYPVPNKWGKLGWTNIALKNVRKEMLADALTTGYCTVAPKRLAKLYLLE